MPALITSSKLSKLVPFLIQSFVFIYFTENSSDTHGIHSQSLIIDKMCVFVCGWSENDFRCVTMPASSLTVVNTCWAHRLHNVTISLVVAHRIAGNKPISKIKTKICRFDSQRDYNTLTRILCACCIAQATKICI